ncbi:MAG: efflux RND transporter periplasmic adaptor subunit [Planctomycetaceae bacterium]|nr:efflux RND transporter periplasmic adaptor subunit [Planctomycetaceae bacterium]
MSERHHTCPELPAPPGRLILFGLLALLAGTAVAVGLRCPRHPQVAGYLASRTTHVISDRDGTVLEFSVREGEDVGLDTPLIQLSDQELADRIAQQEQTVATLQRELDRCLAEADLEVEWRLRELNADLCDIQLRSAGFLKDRYNHQLRHTMLADLLQGNSIVMNDGGDSLFESVIIGQSLGQTDRITSMLELEAAANSAEVSAAQVEICESQIKQLTDLKGRIPDQVRKSAGVDVAQARMDQAEEELAQLKQRESRLTICSPAIGRAGVFQVRRGDHVAVGTPIVELLDSSERYLVAHVPSQQIAAYEIGTRVRLIFPGSEYREGRVYNIAPQANPHSEQLMTVNTDAAVTILIEQMGEVWPDVPIGSRVIVEVRE